MLESYLDPERDAWQMPERVMDALGRGPGDRVADIGCGSGYFTFLFARRLQKRGLVYAVDIDPEAIRFIRERIAAEHRPEWAPVVPIRSRHDHPLLPENSIDVAFLCDAHFLLPGEKGPWRECLASIRRALKPGGRLAVLEHRENPEYGGFIPEEALAAHLQGEGLELLESHRFLPFQHFLVFSPKDR